jgi:hypothetical protein
MVWLPCCSSKHIHQFLGELDRRDITWSLSPLHKVGHQPE